MPAGTYPVRVTCAGTDATAEGRLTVVKNPRDLPDPRFDSAPRDAGPGYDAAGRDGRPDAGEGTDRRGHDESADRTGRGSEFGDRDAYEEEYGDFAGREPGRPHASPVAPVPAGGGGSAPAAEPPDTAGLVLAGTTAAIAGGLIWYRRRTNATQRW